MKTKKKVYKEFGEGLRYLIHDGEKPVFRYVGSLRNKRTGQRTGQRTGKRTGQRTGKRTRKKRAKQRSVRKRC